MAATGQAHTPGSARLLALGAVLLGLFLMHGTPAAAAGGCHGAVPAAPNVAAPMSAVPMSAVPTTVGHTAAAFRPAVPMVHPGNQQAGASSAMHGMLCVSTPARERTAQPVGGMVAGIVMPAALLLADRPRILGRTGRRGPPPVTGRSLLLQVCIART